MVNVARFDKAAATDEKVDAAIRIKRRNAITESGTLAMHIVEAPENRKEWMGVNAVRIETELTVE